MPRGEAEYCASNSQIFLPVSASSATTRLYGVARYITSPTTRGVVLDCRTRGSPRAATPPPARRIYYRRLGVERPDHLQFRHVLRIDLLERRVSRSARIV